MKKSESLAEHVWTFWSNRPLADCCNNSICPELNPVYTRLCPPERHSKCGETAKCMRETPGCAWDEHYLAKQLIPAYKRRAGKRAFSIPLRANESAHIERWLRARYKRCRAVCVKFTSIR